MKTNRWPQIGPTREHFSDHSGTTGVPGKHTRKLAPCPIEFGNLAGDFQHGGCGINNGIISMMHILRHVAMILAIQFARLFGDALLAHWLGTMNDPTNGTPKGARPGHARAMRGPRKGHGQSEAAQCPGRSRGPTSASAPHPSVAQGVRDGICPRERM